MRRRLRSWSRPETRKATSTLAARTWAPSPSARLRLIVPAARQDRAQGRRRRVPADWLERQPVAYCRSPESARGPRRGAALHDDLEGTVARHGGRGAPAAGDTPGDEAGKRERRERRRPLGRPAQLVEGRRRGAERCRRIGTHLGRHQPTLLDERVSPADGRARRSGPPGGARPGPTGAWIVRGRAWWCGDGHRLLLGCRIVETGPPGRGSGVPAVDASE